ncbi:8110_t:CDS:2 [Rhizophagus irregularis]|nr:8110_t:CDS:2 [Rhizophagus irregularis]
MNLIDLLYRHRRSEPTILLGLKLFTMTILMACLTGYLVVVIIDVKQDDGLIIKTSYINVDAIPPPTVYFFASYNFSISTCIQIYFANTTVKCSPEDSEVTAYQNGIYYRVYNPSPNVLFNDSLTGLTLILTTSEDFNPNTDQEINVSAFDSEMTAYDDSIYNLNKYKIKPAQFYDFSYSRVIRESMKPNWMNDFGVPPTYEQQSNIESALLGGPLLYKSTEGSLISFNIKPKSKNVIRVEKEVRSKTYLSGLGLIGGAWGLIAALYAFLFGADTLRPWGAVQSYCCGISRFTQKKLNKIFPIIPFSDTSYKNFKKYPPYHELSSDEQTELRINSLELFLREYVVNVHYLDGIQDRLVIRPKTISDSTTNQEAQNMKEEFDNLNANSTTHFTESTVTQQQEGLVNDSITVKYD